jgi:hypothetical protein
VDHRGASEEAGAFTRETVLETIEKDFPMLRCIEERTTLEIRPYAGWNRSKAVEWLVKTVRYKRNTGVWKPGGGLRRGRMEGWRGVVGDVVGGWVCSESSWAAGLGVNVFFGRGRRRGVGEAYILFPFALSVTWWGNLSSHTNRSLPRTTHACTHALNFSMSSPSPPLPPFNPPPPPHSPRTHLYFPRP